VTGSVQSYLKAGFDRYVEELKDFCRIPSVSTDPAYAHGIRSAAEWVARRLTAAGLHNVEIAPTEGGHPVVLAEWFGAPAGAPTVLIYGHYDVQPPDPLALWTTPPFEPAIRAGRLYARGAADDKGPVLVPVLVAEAFLRVEGALPVNLKFLIEGEEEVGSAHLARFIEANTARLASDAILSADGAMWRVDLPTVTVASRGICALEFTVRGAAKDLHSGRHGGTAPNPLHAIAALVASLHDARSRVAVAGFRHGILPPDPALRAAIRTVAMDADAYYASIGAGRPDWATDGEVLLERQWLEPTLELNGLWGGYLGPGTKTVVPDAAHAKLTCRLVPGQDPAAVRAAIEAHLRERCPAEFRLEFAGHTEHATPAYAMDPTDGVLAAAEAVLEQTYGRRPLRVAMGATLPVAELFQRLLGLDTVFFSFATADEDYHAPNEFFRLDRFRDGLRCWAALLMRLGSHEGVVRTNG
jgi:acetylornithine deacetylase/succinyl-diaminopimelate desuccinylase-like protein